MGLIEYGIYCIVVAFIAFIITWVLGEVKAPAFFARIIWVLAGLIVLYRLAVATGLLGHDPRIPHV